MHMHRAADPLRGLIDGRANISVVLATVKTAGAVLRLRYDVLLRECLHSECSLGNALLGALP